MTFSFNDRNHTIEEWYGLDDGEDWIEMRAQSPFKRGERVVFEQRFASMNGARGTVIDIRRSKDGRGERNWSILVQYEGRKLPRWTNPAWLKALPSGAALAIRHVEIPIADNHGDYCPNTVYVRLKWTCPVCGCERGEPYRTVSYDGSRRAYCNGWQNACGHVDGYSSVRKEALDNGLNT